jgi:hypothetical protein
MFFQLSIQNPFYKKNKWKTYLSYNKKVSNLKHFEFEIIRDNYYIFNTRLECSRNKSHAGIDLKINFFGYEITAILYDIRHWNGESGCWIER